jgi:hypothetical protein
MSLSQSVVKYDDIRVRLNSSAKDEDISPFTAVDKYFPFFTLIMELFSIFFLDILFLDYYMFVE